MDPSAIAIGDSGDVYVAGFGSNNVFKITPGGTITEIINSAGDGMGGTLGGAYGLGVDQTENVYVTSYGTHCAFRISPGGVITKIIDQTGDGMGNQLMGPRGVAIDGNGDALIVGFLSNNVFRITPGGTTTQIIDSTGDGLGNQLTYPVEVATRPDGAVCVAGLLSNNAFEVDPGGEITEIIDESGAGPGKELSEAYDIAVGPGNEIYVTGKDSDNAFRITNPTLGTGFCFGDPGNGTPCPCNNDNDGSVPGSGCANGVFASGAHLTGSGEASVVVDTLVLAGTGLEPNNSALYFQANNDLSPGNVWGDGLQCAGGQLKRLGIRFADASGASDTSAWTTPISVKAGNVQAGDTKYYQIWYRNPLNSPCGSDFNSSNGYAITWAAAGEPYDDMVLIPAGEFEMGDHHGVGGTAELPVHPVYLDAFYMDVYEVSNQKYADYLNSALSEGRITVTGNVVYQSAGAGEVLCDTSLSTFYSRITWSGSTFGVQAGREDHPMQGS